MPKYLTSDEVSERARISRNSLNYWALSAGVKKLGHRLVNGTSRTIWPADAARRIRACIAGKKEQRQKAAAL